MLLADAREAVAESLRLEYGALRHEIAVAVLIDAQARLIDIREFPQGKASHCEISPRILAGWIVETGAAAVLLAHNHPSGECSPSKADIELTNHIGPWLAAMDCELIDHLVLTTGDTASILGNWL
jgi:DNA repair protein RadC